MADASSNTGATPRSHAADEAALAAARAAIVSGADRRPSDGPTSVLGSIGGEQVDSHPDAGSWGDRTDSPVLVKPDMPPVGLLGRGGMSFRHRPSEMAVIDGDPTDSSTVPARTKSFGRGEIHLAVRKAAADLDIPFTAGSPYGPAEAKRARPGTHGSTRMAPGRSRLGTAGSNVPPRSPMVTAAGRKGAGAKGTSTGHSHHRIGRRSVRRSNEASPRSSARPYTSPDGPNYKALRESPAGSGLPSAGVSANASFDSLPGVVDPAVAGMAGGGPAAAWGSSQGFSGTPTAGGGGGMTQYGSLATGPSGRPMTGPGLYTSDGRVAATPVAVPISQRAATAYANLRERPVNPDESLYFDLPRSPYAGHAHLGGGPSTESRDVSYVGDAPQHGFAPPSKARIGPTLLPRKDWIVRKSKLPPTLSQEGDSHYDAEKRQWVTTVFPSLFPSGRQDVALLGSWLDANEPPRFEVPDLRPGAQSKAKITAITNDAIMQLGKAQEVYAAAFNEVVRQVATYCVERGQLMSRIWAAFIDLFGGIVSLMRPLRDRVIELESINEESRLDNTSASTEITTLKTQLTELQNALNASELKREMLMNDIKAKDRILGRQHLDKDTRGFRASYTLGGGDEALQADLEEAMRDMEAMTDKVNDIGGKLDDLQKAHSKLLAEYEAAKKKSEEMQESKEAADRALEEAQEAVKELEENHVPQSEDMQAMHKKVAALQAALANPNLSPEEAAEMAGNILEQKEELEQMMERHMKKFAEEMQQVSHLKKHIALLQRRVRELEAGAKLRDDLIEMLRARLRAAGVEVDDELQGALDELNAHKVVENESYMMLLEFPDFMVSPLDVKQVQTDDVEIGSPGGGHHGHRKGKKGKKGHKRSSTVDGKSWFLAVDVDDSLDDVAEGETTPGGTRKGSSRDLLKSAAKRTTSLGLLGGGGGGGGMSIPEFWDSFIASMPKSAPARPWNLPKFRQMILDCFIEKIKVDSADAAQPTEMTPFVCDFFFQKYGVKRLVQLRLREVIISCRKFRKDDRVAFFSRVCGLWDPLPKEVLEHYLFALSLVMIDFLHANRSGEKMWVNTPDGRTWIPVRITKKCMARLMSTNAEAGPAKIRDLLAELDALPVLTQEKVLGSHAHGPSSSVGSSGAMGAALQLSKSVQSAKKGGAKVELDAFMDIVMREHALQQARQEARYREVFETVDKDGNGTLDCDEFVQAVSMIEGVTMTEQRMRLIFLESIKHQEEEYIDMPQFVDVVKKHNLVFNMDLATVMERSGGIAPTGPPSGPPSRSGSRPSSRGSDQLATVRSEGDVEAIVGQSGNAAQQAHSRRIRRVSVTGEAAEVADQAADEAADDTDDASAGAGETKRVEIDVAQDVRRIDTASQLTELDTAAPKRRHGRRDSLAAILEAQEQYKKTTAESPTHDGAQKGPRLHRPPTEFIRKAIANFSLDVEKPAQDLTELRASWNSMLPTVQQLVTSQHQNPATQILLKTRSVQIENLLSKMEAAVSARKRERRERHRAEAEAAAAAGEDYYSSSDDEDEDAHELDEGWEQFRDFTKDIQRAIRNRRLRAIQYIQKILRGKIWRNRFVRMQWATMLLQMAVRRWVKRTRAGKSDLAEIHRTREERRRSSQLMAATLKEEVTRRLSRASSKRSMGAPGSGASADGAASGPAGSDGDSADAGKSAERDGGGGGGGGGGLPRPASSGSASMASRTSYPGPIAEDRAIGDEGKGSDIDDGADDAGAGAGSSVVDADGNDGGHDEEVADASVRGKLPPVRPPSAGAMLAREGAERTVSSPAAMSVSSAAAGAALAQADEDPGAAGAAKAGARGEAVVGWG